MIVSKLDILKNVSGIGLCFFQYHNAVVLYKQISGTSPSFGNCKIDWNLAVSLSINELTFFIVWYLPSLGEMNQYGLGLEVS